MSTKFNNFANRKNWLASHENPPIVHLVYTSSTDNRAFRAYIKLFKVDDVLKELSSWFHI